MFGIGGGELLLILLLTLMLFGSDKIPEIARMLGKTMAQFKNATDDIKNEITKTARENGFDRASLDDMTGNIASEISKAKENLLNGTNSTINNLKEDVLGDSTKVIEEAKQHIEDATGAVKRNL